MPGDFEQIMLVSIGHSGPPVWIDYMARDCCQSQGKLDKACNVAEFPSRLILWLAGRNGGPTASDRPRQHEKEGKRGLHRLKRFVMDGFVLSQSCRKPHSSALDTLVNSP